MVQIDAIYLILLAEVALLLGVGALIGGVFLVRRRRREQRATAALLEHIKAQQQTTVPTLTGWLGGHHGLTGTELEHTARRLQQEQMALYRAVLDALATRDEPHLLAVSAAVERLTAGYRGLGPPAAGGADPARSADLARENARLAEELTITKQTLDRMLEEYATARGATAPGGGADAGEDLFEAVADDGNDAGDDPTEEGHDDLDRDLFDLPPKAEDVPPHRGDPPPAAGASGRRSLPTDDAPPPPEPALDPDLFDLPAEDGDGDDEPRAGGPPPDAGTAPGGDGDEALHRELESLVAGELGGAQTAPRPAPGTPGVTPPPDGPGKAPT